MVLLAACRGSETPAPAEAPAERPSILLVTLDTTRADAMGPATPAFNALVARGRRFDAAYATVPQTLPSHVSMMTGVYPAGHGLRENGRVLSAKQPLLAEKLRSAGYRTAAFVSAFAVAKRFGLGRGFEVYDEEFGGDRAERDAKATTDRALTYLQQLSGGPVFLWVHYYDPHYPYTPPELYRSQHASNPYLGEVAAMDEQLGRLVKAFEAQASGAKAIVVVADHGEGLGEHGEQQHGNLLYQTTMHVPMVLVAPGVPVSTSAAPVSTRRIFHTILDLSGLDATSSLRGNAMEEVVAGEAMKPFLDYGWQPQVMAVDGTTKAILAGRLEVYDLAADPKELRNVAANASLSRPVRVTLRDYPIPSGAATEPPSTLDDEAQKKLASLGYVSSSARPVIRKDAPVPADMAPMFPLLDRASGLFVREQYREAIPLLEEIHAKDPMNLDTALRLGTAHSVLGNDAAAEAAYRKAQSIAPESRDVRTYLALHYARGEEWKRAVPMLEELVREEPDRVATLEALANLRERADRIEEAVALRQKLFTLRAPSGAEQLRLAQMLMALGRTQPAIASFEDARSRLGSAFSSHLELGVLYLAAGRYPDARTALDQVSSSSRDYPMALFKRAQVSVLLREPDARARIEHARANADATTRVLIERERLFQ